MDDLTVLSHDNDPYRFDTEASHRNGQWFAEQVKRFVPEGKTVHLGGLHYLIVVAADVVLPADLRRKSKLLGKPYENTDEFWVWLQNRASLAARWLGYVEFERIVDERNAEPEIYIAESDPERDRINSLDVGTNSDEIEIPPFAEPQFSWSSTPVPQPYRIILFGEKTSLGPILRPIAQMVGGEMVLPT